MGRAHDYGSPSGRARGSLGTPREPWGRRAACKRSTVRCILPWNAPFRALHVSAALGGHPGADSETVSIRNSSSGDEDRMSDDRYIFAGHAVGVAAHFHKLDDLTNL